MQERGGQPSGCPEHERGEFGAVAVDRAGQGLQGLAGVAVVDEQGEWLAPDVAAVQAAAHSPGPAAHLPLPAVPASSWWSPLTTEREGWSGSSSYRYASGSASPSLWAATAARTAAS